MRPVSQENGTVTLAGGNTEFLAARLKKPILKALQSAGEGVEDVRFVEVIE